MKMEKIKITEITPADYNPRKISEDDYQRLSDSIKTFGLVDPIIINLKNNVVIGGHQRYDVLMEMYMNEEISNELPLIRMGDVGWVFLDDQLDVEDENFEKALNIALNKISGEWDFEKLSIVLDDLAETGFNVDLTGFTEEEFNDLTFSKDEEFNFDDFGFEEDYESPDEKEEKENVYFKLVLMLDSEEEQEELYNHLCEEGYDCQILTY